MTPKPTKLRICGSGGPDAVMISHCWPPRSWAARELKTWVSGIKGRHVLFYVEGAMPYRNTYIHIGGGGGENLGVSSMLRVLA